MTEDEKKRLNELLAANDEDQKEFTLESDANSEFSYQVVDYNPFEIKSAAGEGFTPTQNEIERLKTIDSKLERRNYSRILTGSTRTNGVSPTFSNSAIEAESYRSIMSVERKKIKLNDDFDETTFGDKFIREARLTREENARLKHIDEQLENMRCASNGTDEHSTMRTVTSNGSLIDEETLRNLLDECSMSNRKVISTIQNYKLTTVPEEDATNEEGSVNIENFLYNEEIGDEDEPEINDDVIGRLLLEARNEGIVPVENSPLPNQQNEDFHSFYQEALEIIKTNKLMEVEKLENENSNDDYAVKLPKLLELSDEPERIRTGRTLSRQSESMNILNRASPALTSSLSSQQLNSSIANEQLRDGLISPNLPFLPKIDTRFLPNKN